MNPPYMNLFYLLWRESRDIRSWPGLLAEWAEIQRTEAKRIIENRSVPDEILSRVAEAKDYTVEELHYGALIGSEQIAEENIKYLLDKLRHGEKKKLAEQIGVTPETVSQWSRGNQLPRSKNREKIKSYFGIENAVDLEEHPLFLVQRPLTDEMRRRDLREKIEEADEDSIETYYDALVKLLT
jgi:transcriptional regulator with XRE-family HTH domain